MSILRYTASLDNTITNAFEENLTTRGTGSNMGLADTLEVFFQSTHKQPLLLWSYPGF